MSNWHSRLTYAAWAAPATALCALVIRDQQCNLAKAASGSTVAERTSTYRIECGRWASLPVEASLLYARARTCVHVVAPDQPQAGCRFLPAEGSG